MRVLLQRVTGAQVEVGSRIVGRIEKGLLLYVGIGQSDTSDQAEWLASKITALRVFEDEKGKLNLHAAQVGGAILAVPNFTLMGDVRQGRRPDFSAAAVSRHAKAVFDHFVDRLGQTGLSVRTGSFGTHMHVLNIADGPVNTVLDAPLPAVVSRTCHSTPSVPVPPTDIVNSEDCFNSGDAATSA